MSLRIFRPFFYASSVIAACILLASCGHSSGKKLVLAGSTSVEPFAELWAEAYSAKHPDVKVIVQGGGSSAGIESALTGTSDIGTSSRELKPAEEFAADKSRKLEIVQVAYDAIAVIANSGSALDGLSSAQVRDLFGGRLAKVNGQPVTVVTREEGSGTRQSFEETIMKIPGTKDKLRISNSALVQDSNGAVREVVAGDRAGVGYISLGLVDSRVKPLAIDGVMPGIDTVRNKSYHLVRPFLFVLKNRQNPLAEDFIRFCLSDEGQDIIARRGLIKVKAVQ